MTRMAAYGLGPHGKLQPAGRLSASYFSLSVAMDMCRPYLLLNFRDPLQTDFPGGNGVESEPICMIGGR